jgi:hypothetical protein
MKIGFSFGRCIRDIVNGDVVYEDVYLIVSRTMMFDSSHVDEVVDSYLSRPEYLMGLDEGKCYDVANKLYLEGKLYQPRCHGKNPSRVTEDAVWMDLAPTIMGDEQQTQQVQQAWKNYQLALKMTSLKSFPAVGHIKDNF